MALFPFKPLPHEMILGGFWFLFLNETHFCQFESKPKVISWKHCPETGVFVLDFMPLPCS